MTEEHGGQHDPFHELSEPTRKWLVNLRKEDIDEMRDAMRLYRRVSAGGWLVKIVVGTIVIVFVGAASLGDSIQKVLLLFQHSGKP